MRYWWFLSNAPIIGAVTYTYTSSGGIVLGGIATCNYDPYIADVEATIIINETIASANDRYPIYFNDVIIIDEEIIDDGISQDPEIISISIEEEISLTEAVTIDYQITVAEIIAIEPIIWGSAVIIEKTVTDEIIITEYIPFLIRDDIIITEVITNSVAKNISEDIEITETINLTFDKQLILNESMIINEYLNHYAVGKNFQALQGETDIPTPGYLDHIEFSGIGSVILPVPIFGDQNNQSLTRSMIYNKFGELIYYRNTNLPTQQLLRLQFTQVQLSLLQALQNFISNNLGQKITFLDHENRAWEVIITTPNFKIIENRTIIDIDTELNIPTYDFDLELLGSMK